MDVLAKVFIGIVALFHAYVMFFEMFAWETRGPKVFRSIPKDLFKPTKTLAANLGLYNGFLAAGSIWALLIQDVVWAKNVGLFFMACVAVAGIYGAFTAEKKIFFVQALPALIAIAALLLV